MSSFKELNQQLNIREVVSAHVDIKDNKVVCPFHDDKNPSMIINTDESKRYYNTVHCFVCRKLWDPIGFHAGMTNQSQVESARDLATKFSLEFYAKVDSAAIERRQFINKTVVSLTNTHRKYLIGRGIEQSGIEKFNLGGDGPCIVQPIYDDVGTLKFYNKRSMIDPKGHYLEFEAPKNSVLGGLNVSKSMAGPLYITEGFFDVIQAWQEGIACANVFTNGLSEEQARLALKHFDDIVLAFDNDEAGMQGSLDSYRLLKEISPASSIRFANFNTKDLGDHLYTNDEVDIVSYYQWSIKNNRSRKELLYTIKDYMSPIERKLNILEIARDLEVTQLDVYEELECL